MQVLYTLNNWQQVESLISKEMGISNSPIDEDYFTNLGDGMSVKQRLEKLKVLGATEKTFARINEMCKYDDLIYDYVSLLSDV